ncbi:uncharacterized protein [Periplaneta americana]|uniref:uncharacterized protein n=1 Tax=Periplaneta americana TaxID=6978 RepID=UPI0037E81EFB
MPRGRQMGVACLLCNKIFSNQTNVNRHKREVHDCREKEVIEYDKDVSVFKCLEGCEVSFKYNSDLRIHLQKKHINQECEEQEFSSFEEFMAWMARIEKEHLVQYEKVTGSKGKRDQNIERIYFECVRSGKTRQSLTVRKRSLKSQGSCKLGRFCTSQIIVVHDLTNNKCNAKFYKTHYGHKNELQHLTVPKTYRMEIATELIEGISPTNGCQHLLKCAMGTWCRPVRTVVQQGERGRAYPLAATRAYSALRFLRYPYDALFRSE